MKFVILTLWSILAEGRNASEVQLAEVVANRDDSSRLLGAISALANGDPEVAAMLFREYADELEDCVPASEHPIPGADEEDVTCVCLRCGREADDPTTVTDGARR